MHGSKLFQLIKILKREEFKQLKKFLASPFFNTNMQVIALYNYIDSYYPDFENRKLDKEHAFQVVFPMLKKYDSKKIGNVMSKMNTLLYDYMAQLELQQNPIKKRKLRLSAFESRSNYDFFIKEAKKLDMELTKVVPKESTFYLEKFLLNLKVFFHPNTYKHGKIVESLQASMRNLDTYYSLMKLQLSCEMRFREARLAENHPIKFLNFALKEAKRLSQLTLFKVYLFTFNLIEKGNDKSFQILKSYFLEISEKLPPTDSLMIITQLINHSVKMLNSGEQNYFKESFELYKYGISKGIIFSDEKMTDTTFTNIVMIAIKSNEFDWALEFIGRYNKYLEQEVQTPARVFCLAYVSFNKEEFDETVETILNYNFKQVIYKIRAKMLLLRAIYEQFTFDESQYRLLLYQAQSFEKLVRRNKEKLKLKTIGYIKFTRLLKQISNYKYREYIGQRKSNSNSKEVLLSKIQSENGIFLKEWLVEKSEKL